MPGRTHMQTAMPSSVGLWSAAYAEQLLGDLSLLDPVAALNDTCPLGSAASYGVPLPLDRQFVADLLGFREVQNNVLYVNNSRGKLESMVLDLLSQLMITLSKLAQDLMLFSLPEFGYFSLPPEVCTGSSIMPQKRNPDVLELIRAKTAALAGAAASVKAVVSGLPSGYNRDLQETKGALIRSASTCLLSLRAMEQTVAGLEVHEEALAKGFTPEIYATDIALGLVQDGMPFREAYREVKRRLEAGSTITQMPDPRRVLAKRTSVGAPGNLRLEVAGQQIARRREALKERQDLVEHKVRSLAGSDVALFLS